METAATESVVTALFAGISQGPAFQQMVFRISGASRAQIVMAGIALPVLGAAVMCLLGSVWPIRLDYRALQDMHRLEPLNLPQSSGRFVFLSSDNGMENARVATFALRQLAFPDGSVFWGTLKDRSAGPWTSGFVAVDPGGSCYRPGCGDDGALHWIPAPEAKEQYIQQVNEGARIIYDSAQTEAAFESRWFFLKSATNAVLLPASPPSVARRRFASMFSLSRFFFIIEAVGSFVALTLLLAQLPFLRQTSVILVGAIAVFLTTGLTVWYSYIAQLSGAGPVFAPGLIWTLGLVGAILRSGRQSDRREPEQKVFRNPLSGLGRLAVIFCSAAFVILFLARLDFDGDFFNNWLPQARFFYLLGRHDPAAILGQGYTQGGTYPPGYGILLSTIMWMSHMNPAMSFLPGPDTAFAILIYRLFICALNASLFILIIWYFTSRGRAQSEVWIAALIVTMLLIPSTAGKHIGAETVLFPMMAGSIVLIAAGRRLASNGLTAIGLAIGGMATLVKWEGAIIFVGGALPWLFTAWKPETFRRHRRSLPKLALIVFLACLPTLVWKATLRVENHFFSPVSTANLISGIHRFPGLAASALRLIMEDGRLILLAFGLPSALIFQTKTRPRWPNVLVPASIAALVIGWVGVFLFSNLPAKTYLDTSYSRLIMAPVFSAIIYCADAMIESNWTAAQSKALVAVAGAGRNEQIDRQI